VRLLLLLTKKAKINIIDSIFIHTLKSANHHKKRKYPVRKDKINPNKTGTHSRNKYFTKINCVPTLKYIFEKLTGKLNVTVKSKD
jgi:hypothetical protein